MDWAVQAARRKTQRLPGSSRSIIETLNVFNNVSEEGQERIDVAIREANEWLNGEILVGRAETGKLARQEEEKSGMVSPEKTLNNLEFDDDIEGPENVPDSGTPLRVVREVPSATPRSLADDNYTEEVDKGQDPSGLKAVSDKPWSPFRNEKSLRGSVADRTSAPSSRTENSGATEKSGLTQEVRTSTASDSNATSKSLEQIVRDRSQRRSNMFVPLPSRDPLVVQQAVPTAHKVPNTTLLANSGSPKDRIRTQVTAEKKSLSAHPKPLLTNKRVPTRTRITQSPTYSSTSTRISQATTSVFDRLSSLPTKSFENKVTSKFAGRRISASSSIDIRGSPIRRTSPVRRSSGDTETTYQDTLKNIFFAKDKRSDRGSRSSKDRATLARTRHVDATRVDKNSDGRGSPRSRNAKTPKYHTSPAENNRGYQKGKSGLRALQKADTTESKAAPLKHNAEQGNTARKSPGKLEILSTLRSPTLKSQSIGKSAPKINADPQLNGTLHETHESHIRSPKNKSKSQDRLTKFQLIPPAESESHDLKEKLNKRLSEVMRTQQNQHRRRVDQQKRKPQLDEDFKRRTRLWNEMKETSFSLSAAAHRNSNVTPAQTNTVLYDLSITDHRTVIGGEPESRDPTAGNHTLPEIQSDSDDDADFTLASWAKSPFLQQQLYRQQNWDPREIFGPIPPLHIDQIFPNMRTNKLKPLQPSTKRI
ncbi:hypothetical protein HG537_0G01300 [Torulaspora globosa]|uniref:Inner centromere protein ARK-binding domain-containing protein n=1 Tax=Torulaspora globosa TaxID=48254 RepID=A0A7H9HZ42_9SACH|nr:hypothetical protein HG537_0G01300 [Torulaspora sp. CBS 2947]